MRVCSSLLFALACSSTPELDSATDTGPEVADPAPGETEDDACEPDEVELDPLGPVEPAVGDQWTVWLRCDDATLMGATVLRFEPPDFAIIDGNVATFQQAGSATMTMQVGRYTASMDVTVRE